MAHSLEVRCPLLDRRVVELAFRIPASRKQRRRRGKVLLRALAKRRLPATSGVCRSAASPLRLANGSPASMHRESAEEVLRTNACISGRLDMPSPGTPFRRAPAGGRRITRTRCGHTGCWSDGFVRPRSTSMSTITRVTVSGAVQLGRSRRQEWKERLNEFGSCRSASSP